MTKQSEPATWYRLRLAGVSRIAEVLSTIHQRADLDAVPVSILIGPGSPSADGPVKVVEFLLSSDRPPAEVLSLYAALRGRPEARWISESVADLIARIHLAHEYGIQEPASCKGTLVAGEGKPEIYELVYRDVNQTRYTYRVTTQGALLNHAKELSETFRRISYL